MNRKTDSLRQLGHSATTATRAHVAMWVIAPVCAVCAIVSVVAVARPAHAQAGGAIMGIVRGRDSMPVPDALVRVTHGNFTATARSWDDGSYAFNQLLPGTYELTVRRIGFASFSGHVEVGNRRISTDVHLAPVATTLEAVRVTAAFTGISGVVGEFALMQPLRGASVRLMGGKDTLITAADGRFVVPLSAGGSFALRVEQAGFVPKLVSITVPRGQHVEIAVLLDSAKKKVSDNYVYGELDLRMRAASARAGLIGRAELLTSDAPDLVKALQQSTSPNMKGLTASRTSCVFIDGVARPGIPADAVRIDEVEFIELYPAETDYSNTLAKRWPPNSDCGTANYRSLGASALDIQGSDFRRRDSDPHSAKYILIWTRK